MPSSTQLLVVAGEASGDELAAKVLSHLDVPTFGVGGPHIERCGTELVGRASEIATMGLHGALRLAPRWLLLAVRLLERTRIQRPRAALLVGFSEFNGWLGRQLIRLGVRVLWFAPPQVWAWRPRRAGRLARSCHRMAVLLPFEQPLWERFGVPAHFVGHPAALEPLTPRPRARRLLGVEHDAPLVALLPGSRPSEVTRHLETMLGAARQLRQSHRIQARLLISSALPEDLSDHVRARAAQTAVQCLGPERADLLAAFDAALVKSGTGSLKCALAGATPVIVYQTGRLTALVARQLLTVPNIGLPNLILGRRCYTELCGHGITSAAMVRAARSALSSGAEAAMAREQLTRALLPPGWKSEPIPPGQRVARLLQDWIQ